MPTRNRKQTRANGEQTREKILNAAEELFGAQGFDAVSLRDITDTAQVTLALASYHFGTKERLFEEVVARRASVLCAEREARLDAIDAPDVRALADAFMQPLFAKAMGDEPGWTSYFRVVARLGESDRWLDLLERHFDGTAKRFVAALEQAQPAADRAALLRSFTMLLQVMLSTVSQNRRVDRLADGRVHADALAEAYPVLLDFVTAGIEGVAARR